MDINKQTSEIAKNVRHLRELHGLTREKFCEALNYDINYWGSIERGERPINIQKMLQICDFFKVGLDDLINIKASENKLSDAELEPIFNKLRNCTSTQIAVIEKFLNEILPYVR